MIRAGGSVAHARARSTCSPGFLEARPLVAGRPLSSTLPRSGARTLAINEQHSHICGRRLNMIVRPRGRPFGIAGAMAGPSPVPDSKLYPHAGRLNHHPHLSVPEAR